MGTSLSYSNVPIQIGTDTHWQIVAAGYGHSIAVKTDGTLWGWGFNANGQVGNGTQTTQWVPVQLGSDTDWQTVACGGYHSMALKTDGTLWAWGNNGLGQLGDGTQQHRWVPTPIGTDSDWQSISGGLLHAVAKKTDGTLWTWGYGLYGQLGQNSNFSAYTPTQVDCEFLGVPATEVPHYIVYPNPVATQLTVLAQAPIKTIRLYDAKGILVQTCSIQLDPTVDVSALASGLYLVQVEGVDGEFGFVKVVKR